MINAIIRFSLNNRLLVVALAVLIAAYGAFVAMHLPVDVFPDLNRPTVTIFTEAGGLSPEEVETLVTLPVETTVNGASGVQRVRSISGIGLSIVFVEFDWGTDIYLARQIVTERLQQIQGSLPTNVQPVLGPITSIMGQIILVGLTSNDAKVTPMDLRTIAEWDIRRRMLAIPGVAQVTIMGGDLKQYQVLVSPEKMLTYGVTLHEIEEALQEASANATGGFLISHNEESLVRTLARVQSPDDLNHLLIKRGPNGTQVLLEQVADVREAGTMIKRGDAGVNGQPAVILSIQKQPSADTITLTKAVEAELETIRRQMPAGVQLHDDIFRQSDFIERSISNVEEALRDGSIMVAIVLFLFLLNFRTTFITLTAIPLSLLVTFITFHAFGLTVNTMTLGGLAVAIGELVDDAIVGMENVFRRLGENRGLKEPKPVLEVIYAASSEVRNSIIFATILVVLVFVPLFALGGIEGRIFAPLGVAYIISILASLLVSLTVTPALCMYLLPHMKRLKHGKDSLLVRFCKAVEAFVLKVGFRVPWAVFGVITLCFIAAMAAVPFFGREFLPPFNEGSVTAFVTLPPGTSLDESNRVGSIVERLLQEVPEVGTIGRRTGRAEQDDHAEGVYASEIEFELKQSTRTRAEILADIRGKLAEVPGVSTAIGQPISHRLDHILSGVQAQLAIKIYGDDLTVLREKAEEVRQTIAAVPGIVDAQVERITLIPQVHIIVDREKAARFDLRPGEVAEYGELAMAGKLEGQILEGQKVYDLILRLNDAARGDIDAIRNIPVDTVGGQMIPLGMVANVEEAKGPNQVMRENAQRRIVVSANTAGRDLVTTVKDAQVAIEKQVHLPPEYHLAYEGQFASQEEASRLIAMLSVISFAGMFLVLYSHFRSIAFAAQIMLNIPLAFIGAVIGVKYFAGGVFSIATLVGFITLTGIAARNGIMMISHYLHLMQHEGEKFDQRMIIRGTQERIIPVLMTAFTAALALVPLLMGAGQPGRELLYPVAVVIFYGLFSSTLLNLIVIPLVFWKFGKRSVARLIPDAIVQATQS